MRARDLPYFDTRFVAMAHRGGSLLPGNIGQENTLAAFRRAVELGYRYLETDVHVTADGVLMAFHDPSLDRTTDTTGLIADHSISELAGVRVGGEPIPTMAELLETFPEARFNIDLKAAGTEAPLARLIREHRAENRVCVGSFSQDRLFRFRSLAGRQVATSAGPTEVVLNVVGLPRIPVSWWERIGQEYLAPASSAYQVPVSQQVRGRTIPVVTPGFIRRAHAQGHQVHVWTIDDPVEMERLIDLGVDGLVSDAIDVLREVLVRRGLWE